MHIALRIKSEVFMVEIRIKKGQPYPLGATPKSNGVNFSMVNSSEEECGLILYHKKSGEVQRLCFENKHRTGNISCFFVEGIQTEEYEYNFFIGEKQLVDPYAKCILGNEVWRSAEKEPVCMRGGFYQPQFDWQKTNPLHIPYHESILYCLHVRSYTMHTSSKVKHKGTFEGLVEKLPYLKELGFIKAKLRFPKGTLSLHCVYRDGKAEVKIKTTGSLQARVLEI